MSVNEKMTAIADNIRDKTGGTKALTLDQMASGVNEVFEAGKKAEYNEFWDNVKPTLFDYVFAGTAWNKDVFKPNKDFIIGRYGFYNHNWWGVAYDLAEQLENLGVNMSLDPNAGTQSFRSAWFTRIPVCDFSNIASGMFDRVYYGCNMLVTIDGIKLPPEGTITSFNQPFQNCNKLEDISFDGVIDVSISFQHCPLSVASLKSIITHLKDYSETTSEYSHTVTFDTSVFNTLESSGEKSPNGNTWTEYIDDLKWNLTLA